MTAVILVSLGYGFSLGYRIGCDPLPGYDDAIYAHEAKDLLRRGAFLDVRFNGTARFENPPALDWMILASFRLLGVNELAARLPVALLAWLTFWILLGILRELRLPRPTILLALLVFASSGYWVQYGRRAMTDVPAAFFFSAGILLLLKARRRPVLLVPAFLAGGMIALLKSIFALTFLLAAVPLLALYGRTEWRISAGLWAACLLSFAVPFGLWTAVLYPEYGWQPLGAGFVASKLEGAVRPLHYLELLWGRYQPWYLLLLAGIVLNAARRRRLESVLPLLWLLAVWLPLSFTPAKVTRYLLPAFPAMAILTVHPLLSLLAEAWRRKILWATAVLYLAALAAFAFRPHWLEAPADAAMRELAEGAAGSRMPVLMWNVPADRRNEFLWYSRYYVEEVRSPDLLREGLSKGRLAVVPDQAFPEAHVLAAAGNLKLVTAAPPEAAR